MSTSWNDGVREFVLAFADDEHLMGQQHAEWIGVAPFLEEDLAFCSIGQDELGHAAALYALVAGEGNGEAVDDRTIDALAFDPDPDRWRSCTLVEMPTPDWAHALIRHWLYDAAEEFRWQLVADSTLGPLAEAAARAEREELFHRRHADGLLDLLLPGEEAGPRLLAALTELLPVAVGLFEPVAGEADALGAGVVSAPFYTCLPAWMDQVRIRFGVDSVADAETPASSHHRTARSTHFESLLARMREVLVLDPVAVW